MSRTIGTILNLKDMFSPKIQETTKNTRSFQRELKHAQNNVAGLRKSVTNHFTGMLSSVKSFGLGLASGLSFESMMNSAKAGQKAMGQLNGVLKSTHQAAGMTSKQLTDLAAAQSRQTTFTKGQVIGAESLLLTFTKIGKKTFPDTMLAAENMSTAMGTDLKSSAMMLGKALNDPAAGLSKLTRSGVTFSAQQQKQIKDMQQAGNVAGAQKLMLQELNKEFGGQAVAAGNTYTGVITRIKNTLTGLGGSIGSQLVPYMAQFANALIKVTPVITDVVTTIVSTASPIIKDIVKDIGQIIKNLFPQFNGSMKSAKQITQEVVSNGLNKVKDVFDWMANHGTAVKLAVIGIASAFATFKTIGAINNTISTLKNFKKTVTDIKLLMSAKGEGGLLKGLFAGGPGIMLIITGIALGAYLIITHWTQIKTFFNGLFAWLKAFFSKWGLTIVTILFPFIGIPLQIIKHWSQIKTFFAGIFNWLKGFFSKWGLTILTVLVPFIGIPLQIIKHWSQIKSFFSSLGASIKATWNKLLAWFASLPGRLYQYGRNMFVSFKNGAWNIISGIGAWIKQKFQNFINFFLNLPKNAIKWGASIINNLKQGIDYKVDSVVQSATKLGSKLLSAIKGVFGIHSPSKEMYKIGGYLVAGLQNGISSGKGALKALTEKIFGGVISFGKGAVSNAKVGAWLTTALGLTGTSITQLPGLMHLVQLESGGDPNNWNPQSVGGEHATGLLQMLRSTFEEFKLGALNNITNPIDNSASAIRYIKSRYGSVYNIPHLYGGGYKGYWTGTSNASSGVGEIAEDKAELVTGRRFWKYNGGEQVFNGNDTSKMLGGKHISITVPVTIQGNVIGNEEYTQYMANKTAEKILAAINNM